MPPLKQYLVGGAVRALVMGVPANDRDFVVVGETWESMEARGFLPVGAAFPVFLHPETKEEYALARVEKKTGRSHVDFETITDGVGLERDLERRDLTMNAMAMADDGTIVDPFGGRQDIEAKLLRHVGPAFAEDPLRVLRIARFAAQTGFTIAPETLELAKSMAKAGDLGHLTAERVSQEMMKALKAPHRSRFFAVLRGMDALPVVFPEIAALIGQTQPFLHHEEGDSFDHTLLTLDAAPANDVLTAFCVLVHDLGKGLTKKEDLPKHYGHEEAGVPIVSALARRLKLSKEFERAGMKAARYHGHVHKAMQLTGSKFVDIFEQSGGLTQVGDLETVSKVAIADYEGHVNDRVRADPTGGERNAEFFMAVLRAVAAVRPSQFISDDELKAMPPMLIKARLHQWRVAAAKEKIAELRSEADTTPTPGF